MTSWRISFPPISSHFLPFSSSYFVCWRGGCQAKTAKATGKLNDVLVPAPPKREGTGLKEWDESLLALGITVHGSTDAARVRSALSQACAAGASLRVLGTLLDILRFIPCKPGKVSFAGDTKAVSVKELVSRPCAWDGDHVDWCPGGFSGSNTHGHFQNADWC